MSDPMIDKFTPKFGRRDPMQQERANVLTRSLPPGGNANFMKPGLANMFEGMKQDLPGTPQGNPDYNPRLRKFGMDKQLEYLQAQKGGATFPELNALIDQWEQEQGQQGLFQNQMPMSPLGSIPGR